MPATPDTVYTAITFAPVQGFIEKSRKLRDLYGSSFILSYLARALCDAAEAAGHRVISPALTNVTQGTPNQVVIWGAFAKDDAQFALLNAWKAIVSLCCDEVERRLPESQLAGCYTWRRVWNAWGEHAWEFFWAQGPTISAARTALHQVKRSRAWTGLNWHGESSTLSGADAIAWYGMAEAMHPKASAAAQDDKIQVYCQQLSQALPNSIVDDTEQLSIPELIKRVLMVEDFNFSAQIQKWPKKLQQFPLPAIEPLKGFADINRFKEDRWTGWFQGDGDRMGHFLQTVCGDDPDQLSAFSHAMLTWGQGFQVGFDQANGRIIYAGGDDFLGVFYRKKPASALSGQEVLDWFCDFPQLWEGHGQRYPDGIPLTVSVGLVWAAPQVPQRDVLQHCKEAEQAAKQGGRDRLCIRILFNGGNYLQWICPWWFLDVLGEGCDRHTYRDRQGRQGVLANWNHIFADIATLEARHGFRHNRETALAIFEVYFGPERRTLLENHLWTSDNRPGILGNQEISPQNTTQCLNQWVINLAKVGFHLHRCPEPISGQSSMLPAA